MNAPIMLYQEILNGSLLKPSYSNYFDYEILLGINEEVPKMKLFIETVSKVLEDVKVPYSLIGALATNFYSNKPRNTADIDLLFHKKDKGEIIQSFTKNGFILDKGSRLPFITTLIHPEFKCYGVDLMFSVGDPEESAIELSRDVSIYGSKYKLMPGEFLVWILLLSNLQKHQQDVENILKKSKLVDINKLKGYLKYVKDDDTKEKNERLFMFLNEGIY